MSRRLRSTVYLTGEDGSTVCLLAGSVPTVAQAARITNPKAWEAGEAAPPTSPISTPEPVPPAPAADIPSARRQPPRKGPGSSRAAWATYAASRNITVPEGADRDAIVAAVDAADRG